MAQKLSKLSKKLHNKINSYLKKEQVTPRGGSSAINYTKESIYSGLTPSKLADVLKKLRQGNPRDFLILAEEFEEKDPHFTSVVQTRKRALITVEPTLLTGEITNKNVIDKAYSFIEKPFFNNLVMDLLDAIVKGFAVCEMLWSEEGELAGYKYLPAYWFAYNEYGELKIWNNEQTKLEDISNNKLFDKKFIVHSPKSKSSLQSRNGLSIPASAYLLYKAYCMRDYMAFAEVFGMPLRVGKYGAEATEKDLATLKNAIANLGHDAGAVVPESMNIEFHEVTKKDGSSLYSALLNYLDKQISKLMLGQTMTADDGSSQAQAKVHNEIRLDIVKSDARELESTLNKFLENYIEQTVGLQPEYPKIKWQIKEQEDKSAIAEILAKTLPLGLEISKSDVLEKLGFIPPLNDDDKLSYTNEQNLQANSANKLNLHAKQEEQDAIDELEEILLSDKKVENIQNQLVKPLLKLIKNSNSYDDLSNKLANIGLDSTLLQELLSEATTAENIIGEQKDDL